MPVQTTYPGVYVEERPSGVRTITGVSTSTALFVGMARRGPIGVPTPVRSFDQYAGSFGDDVEYGEMAAQVRQFFLNGGTNAVIVRAAQGADPASVELEMESGASSVLRLTARDAGLLGNLIRARVDYDTPQPELTYNLAVFRRTVDSTGAVVIEDEENFAGLSADPTHPRFVESVVNNESALVEAESLGTAGVTTGGFSQSALIVAGDAEALRTALEAELAGATDISIAVDGGPPVVVSLPTSAATFDAWRLAAEAAIGAALTSAGQAASVTITSQAFAGGQSLRITSDTGPSVVVTPAPLDDVSVAMQLGSAAGGLELGPWSRFRPAESGFGTKISQATTAAAANNTNLSRLADLAQGARFTAWTITGTMPNVPAADTPITFGGAGTDFDEGDTVAGSSLRNVAGHLDTLVAGLQTALGTDWDVARHGYRVNLQPNFGDSNAGADATLTSSGGVIIGAAAGIAASGPAQNTAHYSLGISGATNRQTAGVDGTDGTAPILDDYEDAFSEVERNAFVNLVVLPRGDGQDDAARALLWGPASAWARTVRAFLIVDPPSDSGAWSTVDQAAAGIGNVRLGAVTDHAAIYWPRVSVGFRTTAIDPAGTVAGVMARTDTRVGVWKAPAGLTARTLGARGLEHLVTDPENGVTNPEAINTLRQFAGGAVVWGARTMAGFDNSGENDYKYVPVRRMALFLEESLYRGLQFAVFEPNDYRLWAQIRLAAGAFMQNLFRQGAFQGEKATDAYMVICDETTTTQNDINLGRVNVTVLFAPLRPAEFVVLTIQQLAGQIQT